MPIIVEQKRQKGGKLKVTQAGTPDYAAKPSSKKGTASRLPRKLRANIYLAHSYFQFDREIEAIEHYADGKRSAARLRQCIDPAMTAKYEKAIGQEWSHILRNQPHTYSGLKVEALAKALHAGLHRWYKTIYHRLVAGRPLLGVLDRAAVSYIFARHDSCSSNESWESTYGIKAQKQTGRSAGRAIRYVTSSVSAAVRFLLKVSGGFLSNSGWSTMRVLYLLFLVAFAGAVAAFAYFNRGEVEVRFLHGSVTTSLAALAGAAYLLGMLSGWAVVGLLRRSLQRVTEPEYRR